MDINFGKYQRIVDIQEAMADLWIDSREADPSERQYLEGLVRDLQDEFTAAIESELMYVRVNKHTLKGDPAGDYNFMIFVRKTRNENFSDWVTISNVKTPWNKARRTEINWSALGSQKIEGAELMRDALNLAISIAYQLDMMFTTWANMPG